MAMVYFTLDEILKHDGKDGNKMWIVVKYCVYDVTGYIAKDEHPGGVELIEEWAGKDASKAFDNAGHSGDAKTELKKYKIGEVAEEDRNKKPIKSKTNATVANGKSKKTSKSVLATDENSKRSFMSIVTCGLMA